MNMIRHHHNDMQHETFAVIMNAMPKNDAPSLTGKRLTAECAESNKKNAIEFLMMRQPTPVFVLVCDKLHTRVARTLLSALPISIPTLKEQPVSNRRPKNL